MDGDDDVTLSVDVERRVFLQNRPNVSVLIGKAKATE